MTNLNDNRQDRIKYLRKQEHLKRRLPEFLSSLTLIAGLPITVNDVLSIEEADKIWTRIHKNEKLQQANLSVSFPYRDKGKLTTVFKALQSSLTGQKQYFTTHKFYEICFLLIDTSFCADNYEKLIEYDGNTFFIYGNDLNNSLSVDTSEEHWRDKEEYTWTYELRVHGVDWIDKIYKAYKEVETL
jgi:hypothetical protein